MTQVAILYPLFVQIFLTFAVLISLAFARGRAIRKIEGGRGNAELAMGRVAWPDDAAKRAANLGNQFELPVLFYVVVILALVVKGADFPMLVLAWLFVVTRLVHAAIHVGPNDVRWRTPAFALGCLVLMIMWVKLALHVATAGSA